MGEVMKSRKGCKYKKDGVLCVQRTEPIYGERLDLFNNNMGLLFSTFKRYKETLDSLGVELDDALQVARCALWSAAASYNPSRSKFSTYAVNVIRNRMRGLIIETRRRSSKRRGTKFVSLSQMGLGKYYQDGARVLDTTLAKPESSPIEEAYDLIPSTFTARQREVVRRRIDGWKWPEIAKEFGYSRADGAQSSIKDSYKRAMERSNRCQPTKASCAAAAADA